MARSLPPLSGLLQLTERLVGEFAGVLPAGAVIRVVTAVRVRTLALVETQVDLLARVEREARATLVELAQTAPLPQPSFLRTAARRVDRENEVGGGPGGR